MKTIIFLLASAILALPSPGFSFEIPQTSRQLVVGISKHWDSSEVLLQRWERQSSGKWKRVGSRWKGRIGREGSAWGLGIHPDVPFGPTKKEGDGRAPAGVFRIGHAYGYAPGVTKQPALVYHQITERDMWVEDSTSEYYNCHLQLTDRTPETPWELQAQMRMNDPAHALKLFIGHNAPPNAVPGAGSAIFFHIWRRNGDAPTSGCTVQEEKHLRSLIAWVDPEQKPLYVLLPEEVYDRFREAWKLP